MGTQALPAYDDPVVAGVVERLGGPPGRRARGGERRFWTPVRWLVLATLVTSALGLWQKAPCRVHDWAEEYQYTRGCYTDVLALYYAERLDAGATPYRDHPVEYPVVIGGAMALAAGFADDLAALLPGSRVQRAEKALAQAGASGDRSGDDRADREQQVQTAEAELRAAEGNARAHSFFDLTWVLLTACAVVVTVTTARLAGRRRAWDAAMVALAPGLLLHATTNWDLIAVALAGLGLLAWARRRPVLAGVLLGLATATKLYPVIFLVPLLALGWRVGRLRPALVTSVALVATAVGLTLPVYLTSPAFAEVDGGQVVVAASPLDRLGEQGLAALAPHVTAASPSGTGTVEGINAVYRFVELNRERPADWDSLFFALQTARDEATGPVGPVAGAVAGVVLDADRVAGEAPSRLNLSVAVGVLLVLALVVLLAVRAPRRPRLTQLLFLALAGFLLTNKVYSPQYVLWLLPLAVLARPRWGPFLAWQAAEAFLLFTRFYFFVSMSTGEGDQPNEGIDVWWFVCAVLVRDALLLLLVAAVVRDVLRPGHDVVRAAGLDDPAGGVLDGALDRPGRAAVSR